MNLKEQLIDLRRFNTITSNGQKPQLDSHLEICLLLGIPFIKKKEIAFQMPFWDLIEMYPLQGILGNKVPGRMYMLCHTLYNGDMKQAADDLFAYGYHNMYRQTYKLIPESFMMGLPDIQVELESLAVPFEASRWTGEPYQSILVASLFNPYPVIFKLKEETGNWYSPNAVWEKYAHKAPKVDTSKLTNDIRNGYNPMFGRYTPKHKFEICDNHKLTDLQLYQSLCGVMPTMPGEEKEELTY